MSKFRSSLIGFSTRLKQYRTRRYCTKGENNVNKKPEKKESSVVAHNNEASESSVSHYEETYKKLQNLDFSTAAKILFTEPQRKKKFGLDWHVVQFIIVCLPSVAVYFVAQYSRSKMKIFDAEREAKKSKKGGKEAKEEAEQKALEIEAATKTQNELTEVKELMGKVVERIGEVEKLVLEMKKPSVNAQTKTQDDHSTKLPAKEEPKPVKEPKANVQKPKKT